MPGSSKRARDAAIEYEPELVEEAVLLVLGGASTDVGAAARLRAAGRHGARVDALYGLPQGSERERAFRRHYRDLFTRLGLSRRIRVLLDEYPVLRRSLARVQVRSTSTGAEPGAVLWESREGRGEGVPSYLVIGVTASGLVRGERLRELLQADLAEAAQIVSGADREAASPRQGVTPSRCPLCRYPTAVWAMVEDVRDIATSVVEDFPSWSPELGICSHCADRYLHLTTPVTS